jgi:hypothetical protein
MPISLERFVELFGFEFDIPAERIDADALLVDLIQLDSLEQLRLALFMEMLLPACELPEQLALEDIRVRDIYHYYSVESARRVAPA